MNKNLMAIILFILCMICLLSCEDEKSQTLEINGKRVAPAADTNQAKVTRVYKDDTNDLRVYEVKHKESTYVVIIDHWNGNSALGVIKQ